MKNNLDSTLNKYVEEISKFYTNKAMKDFSVAAKVTIEELYKEAWKMYDSFIDQFYSYQTTSYVRHGSTSPGSGGINLYRGSEISMQAGKNPSLTIEFSGSAMDGGYKFDSSDQVLNYVMFGIRFPYFNQTMSWSGQYNGKYFSFSGTPTQAFNAFGTDFYNIAQPIFFREWKKMGW